MDFYTYLTAKPVKKKSIYSNNCVQLSAILLLRKFFDISTNGDQARDLISFVNFMKCESFMTISNYFG